MRYSVTPIYALYVWFFFNINYTYEVLGGKILSVHRDLELQKHLRVILQTFYIYLLQRLKIESYEFMSSL